VCISAETGYNMDQLKDKIFDTMNFIRVYCKEARKKADLEEPLIMIRNATIRDMCLKLHKDFVEKFKFVRIWGKSAKFDGQVLRKLGHVIEDGDIVELHMR
ncbi:MAG: TGS domain-containing protein, partial [Nanoarchaeota archaeon]|nr:TGS domain-containing protein [Nanoarchaeota archaeon]